MCYSILRVSFKNDKTRETKECASQEDERQKIAELQSKDQVSAIGIFRHNHNLILKQEWVSEVPQAPTTSAT